MKPPFGMVGLSDAEVDLKNIEQSVRNDMDSAAIKTMAQQFITLFPSLMKAVKSAFMDLDG